jgi:hypothetical protein
MDPGTDAEGFQSCLKPDYRMAGYGELGGYSFPGYRARIQSTNLSGAAMVESLP